MDETPLAGLWHNQCGTFSHHLETSSLCCSVWKNCVGLFNLTYRLLNFGNYIHKFGFEKVIFELEWTTVVEELVEMGFFQAKIFVRCFLLWLWSFLVSATSFTNSDTFRSNVWCMLHTASFFSYPCDKNSLRSFSKETSSKCELPFLILQRNRKWNVASV